MIQQSTFQKRAFPSLDGLRFVAFLHVYIRHAFGPFLNVSNIDLSNTLVGKLFFSFAYGTNIFFVLSGFLITYSFLKEIELTGKLDVFKFYKRRALRIWPLYFTVITCAFVAFSFLKAYVNTSTVIALNPFYYYLFLGNFDIINLSEVSPNKISALGMIWSLSVLEQFYLLWPLLFLLIPKKFYLINFIGVIILSLGFSVTSSNSSYGVHTLTACIYMAVGGLSAYLSLHLKGFKNKIQNLSKKKILISYIAGFLLISYASEILPKNTSSFLFIRITSCFFIAFIILEQNFSTHSFFKLSKSSLLTSLGKYNYGLYLFHMIALFFAHLPFRLFNLPLHKDFSSTLGIAIIALVLTLFMSYLSYEYFEKKFILLKSKHSNKNKIRLSKFTVDKAPEDKTVKESV